MNIITVDPVPPNRAYPCSHICLYGKALAWAIVVPSTDITTEGGIMHARYPDQVGGDNPDIQSYPQGGRVKDEAVRTEAVRCQGDTGVKATQGYPRQGAGDTVGRLRGSQASWRILVHSCGDEFQGSCGTSSGGERRKNSIVWVTCTNSAESKSIRIAASSVMGHSSY